MCMNGKLTRSRCCCEFEIFSAPDTDARHEGSLEASGLLMAKSWGQAACHSSNMWDIGLAALPGYRPASVLTISVAYISTLQIATAFTYHFFSK